MTVPTDPAIRRRALLAGLAAATTRRASAAPAALAFTAIPGQDETRLVERFGRVAAFLHGALGVPVTYVPVKSDPAAVTAGYAPIEQVATATGLLD